MKNDWQTDETKHIGTLPVCVLDREPSGISYLWEPICLFTFPPNIVFNWDESREIVPLFNLLYPLGEHQFKCLPLLSITYLMLHT